MLQSLSVVDSIQAETECLCAGVGICSFVNVCAFVRFCVSLCVEGLIVLLEIARQSELDLGFERRRKKERRKKKPRRRGT